MIRARLRLAAVAAARRCRARKRRQNASTNTVDANAAPTERRPFEPPLCAGREAEARETRTRRSAPVAEAARLTGTRIWCGAEWACTRDASGLRSPRVTGARGRRDACSGAALRPRSSRPDETCTGASARAAVRTVARTAGDRPVFTSVASDTASPAGGNGTAAVGSAGTTTGAGATGGAGSSPVAGGAIGAMSAPGRSSSGSTYPFGSALRRMPR
jgi:hypothetical protein